MQTNPPSSVLQVPPCWHGLDKQLSTTVDEKVFGIKSVHFDDVQIVRGGPKDFFLEVRHSMRK